MSELTLTEYLGLLLENPYDIELVDGLREFLKSPNPANDDQDPLRLLEAARGGHERRGDFLAASWLMELETELVADDPDFQKVLVKELGRVRRDELMDDRGALVAYEQLGGLASDDPEVAQAVDQIQQVEEKWAEIARRFIEEAREAVDPRLRTSLLTRAASLMWQYGGDPIADEADAIFDEALAADPSHMCTARQYALSLRARGRWDDVVSVFVRAATAARTREEKASAWLQAARVLRRPLEDSERAADAYRKVLKLSPTDSEALGALVEHYTELEAWDELAEMYESALRSRQTLEAEKGMLLQLAMVHWRFRDDPESAEPFFTRLRKIDAAHPGMLDFYRGRIGDEDLNGRFLTILGDALRTTTDPKQKLALARELGHRAQTEDRPERALEAWKLVERLAPGDVDARAALQQLYQLSGKWNALSESIRGEVDALSPDSKEEKLRLLRDLIPIYRDALHLDSMLIQVYGEILVLSPFDSEALSALSELYEGAGRWNELIQILDRQAEVASDTDDKVALYVRIAGLWLERFGNLKQATQPLERVLRLQPDHQEALAQLKDIYTKKRNWEALVAILGREADLADDPSTRLDKKVEMAQLCTERLHKNADAITLWKEILSESPEPAPALDALEKLSEREKDWDTLAEVLKSRADAAASDAKRVEHLHRLGALYMERLERPAEAVEVWVRLLGLDPDNSRVRRMLKDAYLRLNDWESLEQLYAEGEDWAGFAELLGHAAEQAEDSESSVKLSLRAAEIYADRAGDPHRAARYYERALATDATNIEAAEGLLPIYEKDHKWPEYAKTLEVVVAGSDKDEDLDVQIQRLISLRSVYLNRIRDPEASLGWATRAYLLSPADPAIVAGLEESAEASGAYADLVALFRARLATATVSEEERLDLQRRIASIAGERLGESEESIRQLEGILEVVPNDAEAIAVLDRLYRAERRFADLRALYERRLESAADPSEEWVLLNEVAQVEEEQLGDLPAAAERHWKILSKNPHDVDALRAVERLSQQLKQWDRLDAALARRLQSKVGDEDRLAVYLQLADLRRLYLEDSAGALECYRNALALDGRNEVAIAGLEALSAQGGASGLDAIDLLEPAYAKRGHFTKLAELLRTRLENTKDADERRTLKLRLADLSSSELDDATGAYEALESVFLDNPQDVGLLDRLTGVAEASNQQEALSRALVLVLDGGDAEGEVELTLCRRAAELFDVALGTPEAASRFHARILELEPGDAAAFAALKQVYTKHEEWDQLRALYQGRIEATTDAGAKLDLLLQLCFLFEEILDEPKHAISSYEQALELDPTHTPSRRALQRLYARLQRWPELAELLERDLDEASGQEAVDLAYELGTIYENRLGRVVDAVDHFELVLASSPTHLRAQEALERLMGNRDERQRVASILQPIFESQGAWGELAKVLEVQLEDLSDPSSRAAHLVRIGELSETKLRDDELAFDAYARAVREDAADGVARSDLARLASKLGRHRQRAELLERGLATVGDDFVKTEILVELAELWDVSEPEPVEAEKTYQQLIRAERDNPEIVLKASRALERLHAESGDDAALARDLRRQLQFEEDEARRDELYPMLADLFETTLHDADAAIELHQERLENDPTQVDALAALERLYASQNRWEPLVEVLERRAELCDEEQEQLSLARRVAEVHEERLGSVENAISAHRDLISRFGSDEPSLAALTRLYRQTERWPELLEITEMRAVDADDPERRTGFRFEAAELMRNKTGEGERAFELYRDLLDAVPGHAPTVAALEELAAGADAYLRVAAANRLLEQYANDGRPDDQVRMLEIVAAGDDPGERVRALLSAAEISEVQSEDLDAAFELTGRALREGVDLDDLERVLGDYERLADATGGTAELIATLGRIAPELLDADLRTQVRMRAASIARERLSNDDFARTQYQSVLDEQPDHEAALDALLTLVEEAGATRELVELLRRKGELCDDPEERAALLVRQAHLYQSELDDPESAIEALDRALGESDHPLAYEGLERLYRRTQRWDDLATLYEREIDQRIGDPAAVRYELGELCLKWLGEPLRALDQFREALSQNPDHEPTVRALEALVEQSEHRGAAAEMLEPLYLRRMDWAKVTEILEVRLDAEVDPSQRLELLRHLGDVQESHLEDLDGALETYGRLFAEDPHDPHSLETLTRLARSLGRWDRLAAILDATLRAVEVDDGDTAAIALTTARLYDQRLEELNRAGYFYQRALTYDPSNKEAGQALASVYARSGRWEPLLDLDRERESFAESDEERVAILHEIARTEVDALDTPQDGVLTYRRILELDPTNDEAVTQLDALLERTAEWDELAAHIELQIGNAGDPRLALELRQRLGALTETKLDNRAGALDIYEDVLVDRPDYAPAIEAVSRFIEDAEHGPRAVQILEPIHRQSGDWQALVGLLEAKARQLDERFEQAETWREVGRLYEGPGLDAGKAFDAWGKALVAEPADEATRSEVDRLAEALERWEAYIETCEQAAVAAEDPSLQGSFLRSVAETQDRELGDPRASIGTYRRLLEADPEADQTLDDLEGLQVMVGDWEGLSWVYEQKLERAQEPDPRAELLCRLGGLWEEQLSSPERAVEYYQRAADEKPDDGVAYEALDRLFASANDSERLADVLEQRMQVEEQPEVRVEVGMRLAELYEAQLGRPDAACDALRAVAEAEPDHRGALQGLSRLYERQGQWPELVEVLQRRTDTAAHEAERVELTHQLGNIMERELDDELSAIAVYGQILRIDPGHEPSVQALLRITKLADYREDAASVLEPYLRVQERWNDLATLLRLRADAMTDPQDKAEQLVALAEVHEHGRKDPSSALDALLQSIGERPEDEEILDRAESLAAGLERWSDLVEVLFAEASASLDTGRGAALYGRVARICEEELGDLSRAIDAQERALSLLGDDSATLETLDRLLQQTQQWDRVHEVISRRLDLQSADRPTLLLRQGRLRAEQLGDYEGALGAYEKAMEQDPGREDTLAAVRRLAAKPQVAASALDLLEAHYRGAGDLEEVVRLYEERVELAETDADRVALLTEAAAIWENDIGRPEQALKALRDAVRTDPRDLSLIDSLERLAEEAENWEALDGLVEEIGEHGDLDRREIYQLRLRSAGWYLDRLSDPRSAERELTAALGLDPEPLEAHARRVDLIRSQGRTRDLVNALRAWAEVDPGSDRRIVLLREAAELACAELSEPELAADCYQELISIEPEDIDALRALVTIRRDQSRWNEAVGLLERQMELTAGNERAEVARATGQVYRDLLDDPRAAIRAYEVAFEIDENDVGTMDALESLYRDNDRLEALRSLLERRVSSAGDEDRMAVQLRLAKLYEQAFTDQAAAIDIFQQVLLADPSHETANAELDRLYQATGAWDELIALLLSRVGHASSDVQRGLLARIADLHLGKRNDEEAAITIYERINADLGSDEQSLRALAGLYERRGSWTRVADTLERLAGRLDGEAAIELSHRVADVWEQKVGDIAQAGRALRGAHERFPQDADTRERLKAYYETDGDYGALVEVLDGELRAAGSDADRLTLLRAISDVYRDKLDAPGEAASYLERAVELDGSDRAALVPLCDLYMAAGRQQDAVPILRQIIESYGRQRSKDLAAHQHRLGQALAAMGDAEGALAAYDAAFKIDLTNVAILRDLGKLTHAAGDLDRAQKSFRALLLQKLEPDSGIQKADVYFYLGDIAAKTDDTRKAITMLERALAEDSGHAQAAELLAELKG
ncbi:MAG: tetratricopeptide repeat protein [Deltaproteobacteria bacterium]|nr:tetratricopeptide repeat protein [Deltaproteobacteria bacterium]NNK07528.1 tetratricopeptide repeat protein [Myxococcales bacterium]